jgi:hypothetical protein
MKKDQIRIGGTYLAKVTDKVVPVRLDAENPHGGWDATNLATNKKVRIKSAQRLRGPAPERDASQRARSVAEAQAADAAANAHAVDPDRVPLAEAMKPAKATKGTKAKAAKADKVKKPSGLDAAAQVLKDAGEPMRCGDMVEKMLATGLWKTGGKTPAATIYAAITREISVKGTDSRFKKTDRGLFTVNAK